jgi:hypothetical protein
LIDRDRIGYIERQIKRDPLALICIFQVSPDLPEPDSTAEISLDVFSLSKQL